MNSIELFAGAGGLALATANAGFHHKAVLEWNPNACSTLRQNQTDGLSQFAHVDSVSSHIVTKDGYFVLNSFGKNRKKCPLLEESVAIAWLSRVILHNVGFGHC